MLSSFYFILAKWIFIVLDFFLIAFFAYMLFKTRRFWEKPRLYYPWEKKRLLEESAEKKENERGENQAH